MLDLRSRLNRDAGAGECSSIAAGEDVIPYLISQVYLSRPNSGFSSFVVLKRCENRALSDRSETYLGLLRFIG